MRYRIKAGYQERPDPEFCDQRGNSDSCQWAVYDYASKLPRISSVLDVGCGGAYKLMTFFHDRYTRGLEIEPTLSWLRSSWVDRDWQQSDFDGPAHKGFDLLLCADVIEHLLEPDELLGFIERCAPGVIVISTPDRDRLLECFHEGPPRNPGHVREWNSEEFAAYIGERFEILEHHLPPNGQYDLSTQFIVAKLKRQQCP